LVGILGRCVAFAYLPMGKSSTERCVALAFVHPVVWAGGGAAAHMAWSSSEISFYQYFNGIPSFFISWFHLGLFVFCYCGILCMICVVNTSSFMLPLVMF
jgi:hypothetical protein